MYTEVKNVRIAYVTKVMLVMMVMLVARHPFVRTHGLHTDTCGVRQASPWAAPTAQGS